MQILKEVKIGRLALAIFATVLIADTVPHPNLSAGLLENSWNYMGHSWLSQKAVTATVATPQN